jgi:hypothetical protein
MYILNADNPREPGIDARDGEDKPLEDFKTQTLYETAGWDFTAGSGDWKFLPAGSGYDYPVLSWQDAKPGFALEEARQGGLDLEIEWE